MRLPIRLGLTFRLCLCACDCIGQEFSAELFGAGVKVKGQMLQPLLNIGRRLDKEAFHGFPAFVPAHVDAGYRRPPR